MKRRGLLTALLAAPFAALASTAMGFGRRRHKRGCDAAPCYEDVRSGIEDVTVCAVLNDMMYTITVKANITFPMSTGDPHEPESIIVVPDHMAIVARVVDTQHLNPMGEPTEVVSSMMMTSNGGDSYILTADAPLADGYALKAIVEAAHKVTICTSGTSCPR